MAQSPFPCCTISRNSKEGILYPMILVITYRRKVIDKAFPTGCRVIEAYQKRIPHHPKIPSERVFLVTKFRLLTTGGAPIETIKKQIENQGERNR